MSNLILPKSNVMLASCKEVDALCAPLWKKGITSFCYTRTYDDGTFIDVVSNSAVIERFYYCEDELYNYYPPDVRPEEFVGEYVLYNSLSQENLALTVLSKQLNIDNIFVIVKRRRNYHEVFNFGSSRDNIEIVNFYINNLNFLERFIYFFRDKAKSIIRKYEQDRIIRVIENLSEQLIKNESLPTHIDPSCFQQAIEVERYYFSEYDDKVFLTHREIECLKWCVYGKTACEIALLLQISKRTVEAHLSAIKQKFNCYKQADLIRKALKLRIFPEL